MQVLSASPDASEADLEAMVAAAEQLPLDFGKDLEVGGSIHRPSDGHTVAPCVTRMCCLCSLTPIGTRVACARSPLMPHVLPALTQPLLAHVLPALSHL